MIDEITTYTMLGRHGEHYEVPDAIQAAPGLVVFRLPHDLALNNPCRWNIGHHSGGCIAESMRRENALKGAQIMASLHDWTQQPATLEAEVDHRALFNRLAHVDCLPINTEYMRGDVSRNGTYNDADIEKAAAQYTADGYSAVDILTAMHSTVPWMGLDTNDFNEAHDRIVTAAGAN
ncbi:hypothetical protein [Streptomyces sp. bgisy022]|uniref:hypothetical protein n=1 Tax=Streptomyces sp. bgisy022 TaxID=3413769 RepID=UPI003D7502BB